jgi:hypothetical protein
VRYANRPPVALIANCDRWGLTTGVEPVDTSNPHVVDVFVRGFNAQR